MAEIIDPKEALGMDELIAKRSRQLFETSGLYCAESVLQAMCETDGEAPDCVPRMATGFCSGLSRTCGLCGAVAGAVMGLGYYLGRDFGDDLVDPAYSAVQRFLAEFTERFGSTNCRDLTDLDFGKAEDRERFNLDEETRIKCLDMAAFAAGRAMKIVRELS